MMMIDSASLREDNDDRKLLSCKKQCWRKKGIKDNYRKTMTKFIQVCLSFESIYLPCGISGKRILPIRQYSF